MFGDHSVDTERLPAYIMRDNIISAISANQVTVVAGDTGCGKVRKRLLVFSRLPLCRSPSISEASSSVLYSLVDDSSTPACVG